VDQVEMQRRVAGARVARLATVDPHGRPHLVPCVYALQGETLYTPVDHKPKRTRRLQRLRNLELNPAASLLVDHYDEQWEELWWVRVTGTGRLIDSGPELERGRALLVAKYEQYRDAPQLELIVAIDATAWLGWAASEHAG
jgi:PPOX class probable F420-dependent enzyme